MVLNPSLWIRPSGPADGDHSIRGAKRRPSTKKGKTMDQENAKHFEKLGNHLSFYIIHLLIYSTGTRRQEVGRDGGVGGL